MKPLIGSLRARLMLSHLAVVSVGVVVLLVAGSRLSSRFVDPHLRSMSFMMSGGNQATDLEDGVHNGFNLALLWAALISGVVAMAAAAIAASRVLRPLEQVRLVARRLAAGSYRERVPVPKETELAALVGDVNALAQALDETEQRRLRLISEVAHELRTPVATLKGYMEGLLDGVFSPDEPTLAAAIRETTRIERLAIDLSTLSRTEEGQIELDLTTFDLAVLALEVADRLRPQFEANGVELTVAQPAIALVSADRDRLTQVLTNLVGNALAATPSGGHVNVRSAQNGNTATVEIADSGRGLSEAQLSLVFERFYRADRSATGGTGIGLTIARSLARIQGGEVNASSQGLGRGATFTLTMPRVPD